MAEERQGGSGKDVTRQGRTERKPRVRSPFEDFDRVFDNFFTRNWMRPFAAPVEMELWPRADVVDRDNEVYVRAEIPGVDKDAIEISVLEDVVTVRGTVRYQEETTGEYFRSETMRGEFSRAIELPSPVDTEKASASFNNGILELHLPKLEQSKRRTIPVS